MPGFKFPPFIARVSVNKFYVGTAFAVCPRALLTCGHVAEGLRKSPESAYVVFGDAGGKLSRIKITAVKLFQEEDIAILITSRKLPSPGLRLVEGYNREDLRRFLAAGAKMSGYADQDNGQRFREVECGGLKGSPETIEGVLASFQVDSSMGEGMSGSPCIVASQEGGCVIGMARLGGEGVSHSRLISSNSLVKFLATHPPLEGTYQTTKPQHVSTLEDAVHERKRAAIADLVVQATEEIDLVGRTERLLSDDPLRQLFQPLPLLRTVSEEEQHLLTGRLQRRTTAAEMGTFDPAAMEHRAKEYVARAAKSRENAEQPTSTLPAPMWEKTEGPRRERFSIDSVFDEPQTGEGAPRVIFLGAPGGGKSVLMKYLAQSFAHGGRKIFRGQKMLPLLIRLSHWCSSAEARNKATLESFLAEQYPAFSEPEWQRELNRGRILLLLDGLDEVNDPDQRFITAGIQRALGHHLCPVAIACRTFAFPIYQLMLKGATVYELDLLSGDQILNYTRAYFTILNKPTSRPERQMDEILRIPSMSVLAGNPLLLSVICFVLGERQTRQPLAVRTQLFNEAVNLLLSRPRAVTPPLSGRQMNLRRPVLEFASLEIFERQTGQDKAVVLDGSQVLPSFRAAAERTSLPPADGPEILRDAVGRGLIVERREMPANRTVYNYLHLQFHEYLAGCGLIAGGNFVSQVFDRLSSPRWREVILLAIGQVALGEGTGNEFLKVVTRLLAHADPFARFLPRAALLLVVAIPDLSALPREMLETLTQEIIDTYSDNGRLESFPDLARQLEQAFAPLAAVDHGERVLAILLECLQGVEVNPQKAMAAASLIRLTRLYNQDTVTLLLACYRHDQAEWGWPVDAALRDIASHEDEDVGRMLDSHVPFRRLRNDAEGWSRFAADPLWHWIAVTLLGGLDAGRISSLKQARSAAAEAKRRLTEEQSKAEVNQPERDRLNEEQKIADELVKTLLSSVHVLGPQHFHRPGSLSAWLWQVFEQEQPLSEALQELSQRVQSIGDEHELIDAILALACITPVPLLLPLVTNHDRFAKALTRLDAALEVSLEPALNQALGSASGDNVSILSLVEESQHGVFISAVSRSSWRYTAAHPFTLDAARSVADAETKAARQAEFLHRCFLSDSDDKVYNWCVILDTVGKDLGGDPEILARVLASAHHAGNARPWFTRGWPLDPLAPRMNHKPLPARLGQALEALDAIPDTFDFVRSWAITCLAPLLREADMLNEAKYLALTRLSHRYNAQMDAFRALCDDQEFEMLTKGIPLRRLMAWGLQGAGDSYSQCRTLINAFHGNAWVALKARVKKVADPTLRVWLLESLLRVVEPDQQGAILKEARSTAAKIPWDDQDNRTRAVLRLAAFEPATADEVLLEHLKELANELATNPTAAPRLVPALTTLQPYTRGRPDLMPAFQTAVNLLPDERLKVAAQGLVAANVQGAMSKAPGSMTVLGVAAVVFDFRYLLQVPDDLDNMWLALATVDRDKALARLSEAAKPQELRLTRAGTLALVRLVEGNDWETIHSVMPLLRQVDITALPILVKLSQHEDIVIRSHALLLRAACAGIHHDTFPLLVDLLKSDDYLIRSRAALTLHGDFSKETPYLRASRVGEAVLEALAMGRRKERAVDIRVSLVLGWTMERIIFDDSDMVRNWAAAGSGEDSRAEDVQFLLAHINWTAPDVWIEMLIALENSSPRTQQAILKSICVQAHRGAVKGQRLAEITKILSKMEIRPEADISFVEDGPAGIARVALQVLDEVDPDEAPDRRRVATACHRAFLRQVKTLGGELRADPLAEWHAKLALVGSQTKVDSRFERRFMEGGKLLEERPEAIRILVPWLLEELSTKEEDPALERSFVYLRGDLIGVLAEAAEHFPGDFREVARSYPLLTMRLAEAARKGDTFPGRQSAFRLLAVLQVIDLHVASAFYDSLRDVVLVQATAFQSLRFYKEINPTFVATMLEKLQSDTCPTTRYLVSQALAAVAHNIFLPFSIRSQIVTGCQKALSSPDLQQDVYLLESKKTDAWNSYQLANLGRLDRLLYQNLLDLSGVTL